MADEFYEDEEEYEGPPVPRFWKILGKCIKYTAIGLIILINAFLLWRVFFSTSEPTAIKTVAGNDALSSAYEEFLANTDPEKLNFALYQAGKDNIGTNEKWRYPTEPPVGQLKDNDYAQFFLTDVVFFPYADQSQIVLRYNRSALGVLAKDYELSGAPSKSEEVFDVTLVVYFRPSADSEVMSTRLKAEPCSSDTTALYSFWQYSFEGMPTFESITDMNVEIYYKGDVDYAKTPYSVIDIYDLALGTRDYQLDKKDLAVIEGEK